ncbi:hypothetical protein HPB47_020028 [Ixodes persulcatus]|uniref:Uncharacterized protein n=1 Tax=Ixodes persulcatus TaxID=34615 RepID=A0AC60QHF9_IXOPE|nr:hypothetical protein HPB47_020028 [Ixodes persulcatus]
MSHERRLAVGLLFLTLLVKATLSEETWVDKVERRVKQNLGDSIQWISGPNHEHVGPGYPNPQGPQPCSQLWIQAPYSPHRPRQPYPPSYISSYPQQHAQMAEHLGATAPPSAPTAPPVSFEQMPMPPPPYDYKDYKDPSRY